MCQDPFWSLEIIASIGLVEKGYPTSSGTTKYPILSIISTFTFIHIYITFILFKFLMTWGGPPFSFAEVAVFIVLSYVFYVFIHLLIFREREPLPSYWFILQMSTMTRAWLNRGWEPGTQSRSPIWRQGPTFTPRTTFLSMTQLDCIW